MSTERALESIFKRRIYSSVYLWSCIMMLCNVIITQPATFLGEFWLVPAISEREVLLKSLQEFKQTMTTVQLRTQSTFLQWLCGKVVSSYLAVCFIFQQRLVQIVVLCAGVSVRLASGVQHLIKKGLCNVKMTTNRWLVQIITELRQCIIYKLHWGTLIHVMFTHLEVIEWYHILVKPHLTKPLPLK